jgi:hypothetical protein
MLHRKGDDNFYTSTSFSLNPNSSATIHGESYPLYARRGYPSVSVPMITDKCERQYSPVVQSEGKEHCATKENSPVISTTSEIFAKMKRNWKFPFARES